MSDVEIRFGRPDEWRAFGDRRRAFLDRFHRLRESMKAAFIREWSGGETADIIIFFVGRQCVDDFEEILLLCGNAEGHGAQKLLRALFERVVLLKYLHDNPEKVVDYWDFYWVTQQRHAAAIERFWGSGTLDAQKVREVAKNYEAVKGRYKNRTCPKCGHGEPGMAWTSMSVGDMADKVGLGKFVPFSYYEPLLHTHPNVKGMLERLQHGGSGPVSYGERLNRDLADKVLCTAHALMCIVLEVQVDRFKLEGAHYASLGDDFKATWEANGIAPGQPVDAQPA